LLTRYIKAWRKTKEGSELIVVDELGLPAEEIEQIENEQSRFAEGFSELSPDARRVLKTLWHFQREVFGTADQRRWGFSVPAGMPDHGSFDKGVKELQLDRLAHSEGSNLVYLTDPGMEFCNRNSYAIEREPLYYQTFRPVPSNERHFGAQADR
jgi:hypothetical protein